MGYQAHGAGVGVNTRPRNVEEITRAAQAYEYSAQVRLRHWLRAAGTMLKEADIYEREGDDEQAYLLLYRHAHLVLTNLAIHPEAPNDELLREAKRTVQKNLEKLDTLKPRVKRRYERYQDILSEREARRLALSEAQKGDADGDAVAFQELLEPDRRHHLEAEENKELAVQLAQDELSRRAHERTARVQQWAGSERSGKAGATGSRQEADDLSRRLQEVRAQVERPARGPVPSRQQKDINTSYSYPRVHQNHPLRSSDAAQARGPGERKADAQPPQPPPKLATVPASPLPETPVFPNRNDADVLSKDDATPVIPPKLPHQQTATTPPSPKQTPSYTFKPSAYLENGEPLRTLFLSPSLRHRFLSLASSNTRLNLETCGFLAGTLISNAFFISKLVIPAQTSTSDTCEVTDYSDPVDYVDSQGLMILGWIHTHPSQSCFMSSRDLHTQSGHQLLLPESVAIVCAPSKGDQADAGDWAVFRLTDPPGKAAVVACRRPGIFHPHDVDNLYTDALARPGHVVQAPGLDFEVIDLRSKG